jgi:hypothetical protein
LVTAARRIWHEQISLPQPVASIWGSERRTFAAL